MSKGTKQERPRSYSFVNKPPGVEAAEERFGLLNNRQLIGIKMALAFRGSDDFVNDAAYADWKKRATFAMLCVEEELRFLGVWLAVNGYPDDSRL